MLKVDLYNIVSMYAFYIIDYQNYYNFKVN